MLYIVLFSALFTIDIGIATYFVHCKYIVMKKIFLDKIMFIKQKNININERSQTNQTFYFYNQMINLENFDSDLLKIDKNHYQGINIYYIGYITMKKIDDYENVNIVNPFYLIVSHASGYTEEKMERNI